MKAYLAPDIVLRLFINPHDVKNTIHLLKDGDTELILSDFALFEALMCCEPSEVNPETLYQVLQSVTWLETDVPESSFKGISLERKAHLRKIAMASEGRIDQGGIQYGSG